MSLDAAVTPETIMASAKQLAIQEFGQDYIKAHPEVVATIFQGLASLEQAKAMAELGNTISAAAEHIR
jgi:hypothetical protein